MALACGTYIVTRPCRTKPRCFKASDVQRIARYAVDCGADRKEIMARVIYQMGYGPTVCGIIKLASVSLIIVKVVKDAGLTLAVSAGIRALIQWLLRSPLSKVPRFNIYLALLLTVITVLDGILDAVDGIIEGLDTFIEVAETLSELCELSKILEGT